MKEKEMFVNPEIEVVKFPEQDIVTTSGAVSKPSTGGGGIVLPEDTWG